MKKFFVFLMVCVALAAGAERLSLAKCRCEGGSRIIENGRSLFVKHLSYYRPGVLIPDLPAEAGAYYEITARVSAIKPADRNAFYIQVKYPGVHEMHHTESLEVNGPGETAIRYVFQTPEKLPEPRMFLRIFAEITGPEGLICRELTLKKIPRPASHSIIVTSPAYRNSIYHSHPVAEIAGRVEVYPVPAKIRVSLSQCGREIAASTGADFRFGGADRLADGDYDLTAVFFDAEGRRSGSCGTVIHKYPAAEHEVVIGQDNRFYSNGKLFMPLLFYSAKLPEPLRKLAFERGVNLVITHQPTAEKILEELDFARKHNARVMLMLSYDGGHFPARTIEDYRKILDRVLTPAVARHPALFCYYMKDEPEIKGEPLAPLAAATEELHKRDPYHPVYFNADPNGSLQQHRDYAAIADIYGMDIYPVGRKNHGSIGDQSSLTCVGACMKFCVDSVYGRKPIIACLQGYAWNRRKPVYPDLRQSRFMAYDSFFNGAHVISWYGLDRIYDRKFVPVLFHMVDEMKRMTPIFLTGKHLFRTDGEVKSVAVEYNGERFLIAANYQKKACSAELKTPFADGEVNVWYDSRKAKVSGGKISETFEPFEVRVYCTGAAPERAPEAPAEWLAAVLKPLTDASPAAKPQAKAASAAAYPEASWIWAAGDDRSHADVWLIRRFTVKRPVAVAVLTISADSRGEVWIDGESVGRSGNWYEPRKHDVAKFLSPGDHLLAVRAEDKDVKPCRGVVAELAILGFSGDNTFIVTDGNWLGCSASKVTGVPVLGRTEGFLPVRIIAPLGGGTWGKRVQWPVRGF